MKERWLAAVPLFLSLAILGFCVPKVPVFLEIYKALRIDLPLPTVLALHFGQAIARNYFFCLPVMFVLSAIHFGFAAKSRPRLMRMNQIWMFFFIFVVLVFIAGLILPFIKIHAALRRK